MTDWLLPALAGFGTGILSAWGVGGGTLLLLLMTLFLGVDRRRHRASTSSTSCRRRECRSLSTGKTAISTAR